MPTHTFVAHPNGIRMRCCHYCKAPISTAFYLPQVGPNKWACAPCYVEHVVVPATAGKEPSSAVA